MVSFLRAVTVPICDQWRREMFDFIINVILWISGIIIFFSVVTYCDAHNAKVKEQTAQTGNSSGFTIPYGLAMVLAIGITVVIELYFPDILRAVIAVALIPYLKKHHFNK